MEKLGSTAKAQIWVCVWPELYIYTHTHIGHSILSTVYQ